MKRARAASAVICSSCTISSPPTKMAYPLQAVLAAGGGALTVIPVRQHHTVMRPGQCIVCEPTTRVPPFVLVRNARTRQTPRMTPRPSQL